MTVHIVNSFTYNDHGGNPAGVVLVKDTLSAEDMQAISKKVNLSETAFVFPKNNDGHYPIRFFTPTDEVPLCGHATLAAFHVLNTLSLLEFDVATQLTASGILEIKIDGNRVTMRQPVPQHKIISEMARTQLYAIMGLVSTHPELPTEIWSTGLEDVLLPVRTASDLNELNIDLMALSKWSEANHVVGVHAFAIENNAITARNFAPLYGIDEEAATGTSNGALIAYLHHHLHSNQTVLEKEIIQGVAMNQKSAITALSIRNNALWEIWVGGYCRSIKVLHLSEW